MSQISSLTHVPRSLPSLLSPPFPPNWLFHLKVRLENTLQSMPIFIYIYSIAPRSGLCFYELDSLTLATPSTLWGATGRLLCLL